MDRIIRDAAPYFESTFPFMRARVGEELDGNPISYSSIFCHILMDHFIETLQDERCLDYVGALLEQIYEKSVRAPGFLSRGPHKLKDRQTHDDIVHFVTAASRVGGMQKELNEIYNFCEIMGWSYFIEKPETMKERFQSWLLRVPGFKSVVKAAAGKKLSFIEKLWLAFDIYTTTRSEKSSTSGRMMDWSKSKLFAGSTGIVGWAFKKFDHDIRARYPNLMGDVFQIYFQRDDLLVQKPSHVFAVWMQGRV